MNDTAVKQNISNAIQQFDKRDLSTASLELFKTLGYNTERQGRLDKPSRTAFKESFISADSKFNGDKALFDDWEYIDLLFQLSEEEMKKQTSLFDAKKVVVSGDSKIAIESYLFFVIRLSKVQYSRTDLSRITREVNRLFPMPVMILFKTGSSLTLSVINRRLHKKDASKDVLEKVTLIKDIRIENPHRAHIEILFDLSFDELQRKKPLTDFVKLHEAWQKTLDLKELNDRFYKELFKWYLWAVQNVKFPQIRPDEDKLQDEAHQSESVIRLITRLLFCWFMKEKQELIPEILFKKSEIEKILIGFSTDKPNNSVYYRAILQNLFFATLSVPIKDRKYIRDSFQGKNSEHGNPYVFRYQNEFVNPKDNLKLFKDIPFLNGGLFECLDDIPRKDNDVKIEVRLDGFSSTLKNRAIVPDFLFWGEYKEIDLSKAFDNPRKNNETVHGIIDIFNAYKFTVEENTPLEEEIALDPDLLGRTFENLLASYNPETKTNARKQTGSFYTPREIVNYMVDESLVAFLNQKLSDAGVNGNRDERLRELISYEEVNSFYDKNENTIIIQALENLKVLDPACGSGAFPMGILHKLVLILRKVDPDNKKWFESIINRLPAYTQSEMRKKLEGENWDYLRKLGIIQQSIYGVDIQPIAIQIAKLRFFISLLVDQRVRSTPENNFGLLPLPNLDFKLVCANTLIRAPEEFVKEEGKLAFKDTDPFFEKFRDLTNKYFSAYLPKEKKKVSNDINMLVGKKAAEKIAEAERLGTHTDERYSKHMAEKNKAIIEQKKQYAKLWESYPKIFKHGSVGFFDIKYFYPEVKDGFDVVIGNPPYVQIKQIPEVDKPYYIKKFRFATGRFNLFYFFIEITKNLNCNDGIASYIVPDRLLLNTQCHALRSWLLNQQTIIELVSFDDSVFESAVVDSIILFYKNSKNKSSYIHAKPNISIYNINNSLRINIPISYFINTPNNQFDLNYSVSKSNLIEKIRIDSKQLRDISDTKDGIIQSKIPDVLFLDSKDNKFCKKLLFGKNIDRYLLNYDNNWVNYQPDEMMQIELKRGGGGLRLRNKNVFEREKILTRQTADEIIGTIDNENYYYSNTLHGTAITNDKYNIKFVLALLNSKVLNYYYKATTAEDGKVFAQIKIEILRQLPIKFTSYQNKYENIVNYVLILKSKKNEADKPFFEYLLDAMVYELYLPEEIKSADCEILKHLTDLPELKADWSDEQKLQAIEKIYQELSDPKHPVSIAMEKMKTIPEVRIIEGLDK